jgi:hypothetical protein
MWVELYNVGDQAMDIGGWKVSIISTPWMEPISIPEGTQIQSNGFYADEGDSHWSPVNNATVLLEDRRGNKTDKTPLLSDTSHNEFPHSRIIGHWDSDTRADWAWMKATKRQQNNVSSMVIA